MAISNLLLVRTSRNLDGWCTGVGDFSSLATLAKLTGIVFLIDKIADSCGWWKHSTNFDVNHRFWMLGEVNLRFLDQDEAGFGTCSLLWQHLKKYNLYRGYPISRGKIFFKLKNDIGYKFHDFLVSIFINIEKYPPPPPDQWMNPRSIFNPGHITPFSVPRCTQG